MSESGIGTVSGDKILERVGRPITESELLPIRALYESGKYLTAYEAATDAFGPLESWRGPEAMVLAGRMAANLGAPRLGQEIFLRAYRLYPNHDAVRYSYTRLTLDRKGPIRAARLFARWGDEPGTTPSAKAEWFALRGLITSHLRDFDATERWFAAAEAADPNDPWVPVERSSALEHEDRYEEALKVAQKSLELRPWYRAGVQSIAHLLDLLGRDDEALALLKESSEHLESGVMAWQTAYLQSETGDFAGAEESLNRFLALSPLARIPHADDESPEETEPMAAFRSDIAYNLGDFERSIELARKAGTGFHERVAERMASAPENARRLQLEVPFVRQHHVTCAPATLTAVSRFWQKPADHLEIVEQICYDGTPAHSERKWADENGWVAREFTLTWDSARELLDQGIAFTLATMGTGMGHLQAGIGYDERRGVLLFRDPYYRHVGEALMPELLTSQRSSGPRAMAMVPAGDARADILRIVELPDAALYDREYTLQTHLLAHRREEAQAEYDRMLAEAPDHRLTLYARRALASYDANLTELLACADALIAAFPEDSNLTLFRLSLLRELSRREDRLKALEELTRPAEPPKPDAPGGDATEPAPDTLEADMAANVTTSAQGGNEAEPAARRFDPIFWVEYAQELSVDAREQSKALSLLRRTLLFQPTNSHALFLKAQILWRQRKHAESLELYRAASCLDDKDERLAYAYFQAARYLKRTEEALSLLRGRYSRFGKRSSQPARTLFYCLFELDRTQEAFDILEEAIKHRPDEGDLLTYAASRYAQFGKFERAEGLLAAAEGKLSRADSLRAKAGLAASRGANAEALGLWRELLASEPLAMDAHRAVAGLVAASEGVEAVQAHFAPFGERFPHHFGLHQLWVESIREPEMVKEREAVLDRILEINPADAWTRRERGFFYGENNRLKEAMEEAKAAYQRDPTDYSVYVLRGQICLAASKFEEARASFREAIRMSADADYAISQLMRLCDTTQQKRDALSFIREELTRQTIFGDGLLAYRRYARETLTPEELLGTLHRALNDRPDLWHAWSATVEQLIETRRLDEALKFARLEVERFPLLPPVYLDLAEVHGAREETEEEQAVLRQGLALSPNWSPTIRALCSAYERVRQPEKSVELLTASLTREPRNAENSWALATTLWKLGRREEAVERLQATIRIEPRYGGAWSLLDEWGELLGRTDEVARAARDYCRRAPKEPLAHLSLARVLPDTEEYRAERLAHLDEAIRLSPRLWDAYQLKAEILAEARRWDEAFNACRPPVGNRVPPPLLLAASRIEARRTGISAAIQRLRGALAGEPRFYEGWRQLTEWNRAQGASASRSYLESAQKMAELRPQEAVAWGYLADARTRSNDRRGAKEALHHAFAVDPEYSYAGFTLIEMQFEDGEMDAAATTLARLDAVTNDPWVGAFGVRLATRRRDEASARSWLLRLATWPSSEEDMRAALEAALSVYTETGWGEEAISALSEVLRGEAAVRPEVAGAWVQLSLAPTNPDGSRRTPQWSTVETTLPYLRAKGKVGVEGMAAYIEALGEQERGKDLQRFLREHWDYLRGSARTWAMAGQALHSVKEERLAADWCADWELRADLTPWMYLVPVSTLRRQGRDDEANRASRKALEIRPTDNSESRHLVWLALDAALIGNLDEAVPMIERVGDSEELPPFARYLYGLALAMIRVQQTPLAGRRGAFEQSKGILTQTRAIIPDARENATLTRLYARTVRRISQDVGGPVAGMWAMTSARL